MGVYWLSDGVEVGLLLLGLLLLQLHGSVAVADAFGLAELEDDDCEEGSAYDHTNFEDLVVTPPLPFTLLTFFLSQVITVYLI